MASVLRLYVSIMYILQSVITSGITQFVHIIAQIGLLLFGGTVMCSFVYYALFFENLFISYEGKWNREKPVTSYKQNINLFLYAEVIAIHI